MKWAYSSKDTNHLPMLTQTEIRTINSPLAINILNLELKNLATNLTNKICDLT